MQLGDSTPCATYLVVTLLFPMFLSQTLYKSNFFGINCNVEPTYTIKFLISLIFFHKDLILAIFDPLAATPYGTPLHQPS